jgi:hypothetical protein
MIERPISDNEEYGGDYDAWLNSTAQALDEGRIEDVDVVQIAEELRDMSKSERRSLASHMERILVHLLKTRYQPGSFSRSWSLSIAESRVRIKELLQDSPSLTPCLASLMARAYAVARIQAARKTQIALDVFPEACPLTLEDIMERPCDPPDTPFERLSRLR